MNKTLLESLTDVLVGMGLTEDDALPLTDLAATLVELDLDLDGEAQPPRASGGLRERLGRPRREETA